MRTKLERLEPLLFRTQLLGYEGERSGQNHWTDMPQGTACSRAAILGSGRRFCLFEFNYAGCEQSRSEMERWKILHSAKNLKQNKKDSERVVCTFGETHAISAIASSTTRIRGRTLRTETLDQNNVRDCLQSCGYSGKWTSVL